MNMQSGLIYLDNNATTAVARECVEAMLVRLHAAPGNPSSKHGPGEQAKRRLSEARAQVMRKGIKLPPLLFGHQERGRRGGTENLPAIVALGVACDLAMQELETEQAWIKALRDRLETRVLAGIPFARLNGGGTWRLPNTSNIRFGELDVEVILARLDRLGVCASAGAACAAGGAEPSHVLTAMGLERRAALASIRFSLSRYSTAEEIDWLLTVLPGIMHGVAVQAA